MNTAVRLRRPEAALFAVVLAVYAYFYQAGGWNQNVRFDLVRAVVERGSLTIDAYHGNTGDKALRAGHYYSDKAPGVSLLAVPAYAGLHAVGARYRETDRFQALASYLCTVFAVGVPSAAAAVALFAMTRVLALPVAVQATAPLAYAFGTLAFPYSTLLYGHQTAAALLFIAFALLSRTRDAAAARQRRLLLCAGGLLGCALTVEYPSAMASAVLAVYAGTFIRPRHRLGWLLGGMAVPVVLLGAYHAAAFGSPLTLPYEFSTQTQRQAGFFMGLGRPDGQVLREILIGEYRGLLRSAPWLLFAVPGAVLLLRHRRFRPEGAVCLTIAALHVWMNASLNDWHGGWGMGPRHLIPALPFLALLASATALHAAALPRTLRRLAASAGLLALAYSALLMLVATAVKPEVPWQVKQPFEAYLLPAFFEGRLAVNVQSIDMGSWRGYVMRRAWNLGELLGLEGLPTLAPLGVVAAAGIGWWVRALRREACPPGAGPDRWRSSA